MTNALRLKHAELILAAIKTMAQSKTVSNRKLRKYVIDTTSTLDLPNIAGPKP